MGFLIIGLLSVHLLAMNLAGAGPLYAIWLGRRGCEQDTVRGEMGQEMAVFSVWALLLGICTGLGQLYFASSSGMDAAMQRLPVRGLWMATIELAFSLICLLIYAASWRALRNHRWWHAFLALLSCTNLLYHFPPLMSVMGRLASDPTWADAEILDRAALLPLFQRSEVLALSLHFVLASLAVSALAVLWLASRTDKENWESSALPISRRAAGVALLVTALQLPVGIWLLISLPKSDRMAMMGESAVASLAFIGALLLTFILLQRLVAIMIGKVAPRDLRSACWLLIALVVLMTATLRSTRDADQRELEGMASVYQSSSQEEYDDKKQPSRRGRNGCFKFGC